MEFAASMAGVGAFIATIMWIAGPPGDSDMMRKPALVLILVTVISVGLAISANNGKFGISETSDTYVSDKIMHTNVKLSGPHKITRTYRSYHWSVREETSIVVEDLQPEQK